MTTTIPSTPTPGWKIVLLLLVVFGGAFVQYKYDVAAPVKTYVSATYHRWTGTTPVATPAASRPSVPTPPSTLLPIVPKIVEPAVKPTGACPPPITVPSGLTYKPMC